MTVRKTVLSGNVVSQNPLPPMPGRPELVLKGNFHGKPASFGLDKDLLSKHMMLIGGTGCGKSTLFYHIIHQLKARMTSEDVMIIFDTKGDYYSRFFSARDCVIGNSPQYYQQSLRWNIFKEILADGWDDRQVILNTQEICKSFFDERVKKSTANAFFPNAARDLLAAVLTIMARLADGDPQFARQNLYNNRIREYLDSSTAENLCDLLEPETDLRSIQSYIAGDSSQSQGVMAEMYSVLHEIFVGVFAEKGKFSVRDFVRKKGGRTLFIEYDMAIGSVLTPVYKLLFDLALKEALSRNQSQGNVYLICDEFKLLPNLQHIDDGVNFGRSLGVKVFAGLQSIQQLYEIYGDRRGRNLAAGFSSVIAFRANDVSTRKFVTELHGQNMLLEQYQGTNGQTTEEKRIGNSVEDWDMNSLRVGEAIVGLPFSPPFRFYFDMYQG